MRRGFSICSRSVSRSWPEALAYQDSDRGQRCQDKAGRHEQEPDLGSWVPCFYHGLHRGTILPFKKMILFKDLDGLQRVNHWLIIRMVGGGGTLILSRRCLTEV